jgi:AcrR family transcriptional regulator
MEAVLTRRERKKQETRQALLQAALALFHDKGYDETTVEEITGRADVAKGTFFNYFPSKEALLGELAVWRVEQLRVALDVSQGAPASAVARIKLMMRLMHEQMAQDMALARRALATRMSAPPPPPHRAKHRLFGLLVELVREAQSCGEIRPDVDAELISDLLHLGFFRRVVACHPDDGHGAAAHDFEQVIDLWMDGLAGPNWRRS